MAPSFLHQAIVELFQRRPSLAPELLRDALHLDLPAYEDLRIESADLRELTPAEVHADLVVLLLRGKPVLAIIVEVQLRKDAAKRFTWPLYVAGIRRRFSCEACVLVVTPHESVARWARQPIVLGPGGSFEPLVIGPTLVPQVRDQARATEVPELAVLSALAYAHDLEVGPHIALAALSAARDLDDDRAVLYSDVVFASFNQAMRAALEELMLPNGYQFQSDFAKKHQAIGRSEGKAEGKAEGIIRVLEARKLALAPEQHARILSCTDLELLDEWLTRAATATATDELFR